MASSAQFARRERPIQFGKYTLLARMGGGGTGEVYLAQLRSAGGFEKLVAIKRILSHLTDKSEFVEMFVAEARTAARISHPNVCQIYELGQIDGRYYMALEYLEGVPLADVMVARKRAPQLADLRLITSLVAQAAEGLYHAHSLRDADGGRPPLVHGDVNPRNVFVTSAGVAKVLDFGMVKARGAAGAVQTGSAKGSFSYMAPEQLQGEAASDRADIFALGTITWEAVVGRRLFKRASAALTWSAIVEEPIPRITKFRSELPTELDDAIMRALARPATERYQTAREFAAALEQAIRPLGAPLTTLAIAAEMEKAFANELAAQRERVFAAHRKQAENSGPDLPLSDEFGGGTDGGWEEGGSDTRVAAPAYGALVAQMVARPSQQIEVPTEPLSDVSSEELALFETPAIRGVVEPTGPSEAAAAISADDFADKSVPVVLETPPPGAAMRRPSARELDRPRTPGRASAPIAPYLEKDYLLEATTMESMRAPRIRPDAAVLDSLHGIRLASEDDAVAAPRSPRRWLAALALVASAASGAAIVLFLNRDSSPKDRATTPPPAAGEVAGGAAPGSFASPTPSVASGSASSAAVGATPAASGLASPAAGANAAAGGSAAPDPSGTRAPDPAPGLAAQPAPDEANPRERRERTREKKERRAEKGAPDAERRAEKRAPEAERRAEKRPPGPERRAEKAAKERERGEAKPPRETETPLGDAVKPLREVAKRPRDVASGAKPTPAPSGAKPAATNGAKPAATPIAPASAGAKEGGFLTINAEPYAIVFVDGKKLGFTPVVRFALAPGSHQLRLVSSEGQPDKKTSVRIVAGREVRMSVKW